MSAIGQLAVGVEILADWLGGGCKPVAQELADKRAAVCATCPLNVAPLWWEKSVEVAAMEMKRQLAARREMGLSVSVEKDLHMCRACGCCLPLKVHVPIEHIRPHTSLEQKTKFPSHCWLTHEL
jgi:hypothetical protein